LKDGLDRELMAVSVPGQALLDLLVVLNSITGLSLTVFLMSGSQSDLWSSPRSRLLYIAFKY